MNDYLKALMHGKHLTRTETHTVFSQLSTYPLEQQAAFLALLAVKKETVEELLGALDFIVESSTVIPSSYDLVDIVGTGGDGLRTFNISTAASVVMASCGVYVAKHGGRHVTSLTGSADVAEGLGISQHATSKACLKSLKATGYTYVFGPAFNTALQSFALLRQHLAIPTIFNRMGPLINPMQPRRHVIGVSRLDLLRTVSQVLQERGVVHALVVHSADGMDELSVSAATHVVELHHGQWKEYTLTPEEVGLRRSPLQEVQGGDAMKNATLIRGIFTGTVTGAPLDIVLLNTAAGLLVADRVVNFREGVAMARQAIASGETALLLNRLQSEGGSYDVS
jgi:anthranilate phosphoribosyltransferase